MVKKGVAAKGKDEKGSSKDAVNSDLVIVIRTLVMLKNP